MITIIVINFNKYSVLNKNRLSNFLFYMYPFKEGWN